MERGKERRRERRRGRKEGRKRKRKEKEVLMVRVKTNVGSGVESIRERS